MKRITGLFIVLIFVVVPLSIMMTGCGGAEPKEDPNLSFTLNESETGYNVRGKSDVKTTVTEITIPAEYEGKPVIAISAKAFNGFTALTKITIPDSVTSILSSAFENCRALTSVTIPDSVTSLGKTSFKNCTALSSVVIGSGIKTISENAFEGCKALTSVTFPSGLEEIGNNAFLSCSALPSVKFPEGLLNIGSYAFSLCSSLTEIKLPASLTWIGDFAFGQNNGNQYPGNLMKAYFYGPMPNGINQSFGYTWDAEGFRVYVPAQYYEDYRTADAADWQRCVVAFDLLETFDPAEVPYNG